MCEQPSLADRTASRRDAAVKSPLLPREEEAELLRQVGCGDDAALHRLVACHVRTVAAIARRYRGWGVPMSDLVQEGMVGLMTAVRRFDPSHGTRLSTYATWWIRSAIQEHVLRSWSLVRFGSSNAHRMLALRLRRIGGELLAAGNETSEHGMAELARLFGTSAAEVARMAARLTGRDVSLDDRTAPGGSLLDRLTCELPTPEQVVVHRSHHRFLTETIAAALTRLSPRERLVIDRRYFGEVRLTFTAIGRELGLSKDRVRQMEAAALTKLATWLKPALPALRP